MSTLKVAAINNPSASSGGLAISAGGNVTGGGLDLIASQSFSAVSSVSVNSCFTSAYDNYRIVISGVIASTGTNLNMRLRVAGTDSTASYTGAGYYSSPPGSGPAVDSNTGFWSIENINTNCRLFSVVDLGIPAVATITQGTYMSSGRNNSSFIAAQRGLMHDVPTAYDGFTIYPATGTITGTVRVYGYRNA